MWCACAPTQNRLSTKLYDRTIIYMYVGLRNRLHHVYINDRKESVTTKHVTFDNTVFLLSQDIRDEEEMILEVYNLKVFDESNKNMRRKTENCRGVKFS